MTDREKRKFHIPIQLFLIILMTTLESSLWPKILSPIPSPQLWLSVVVFVFLYSTTMESLLIVYLPSLFIYILTIQPLGYILLAQTLIFFIIMAIKNRVFVPGPFYFSVIYASSVFIFHLLIFIFGWVFETKPTTLTQAFGWLTQSIIAFLVSPFLYNVIRKYTPVDETLDTSGDRFI